LSASVIALSAQVIHKKDKTQSSFVLHQV